MSDKLINEDGEEIIDPRKTLAEQTLAVDLERVAIDQQIATAHKFPRSIDVVVKKISTLALYNKESAENCFYALPRGGKPIIGPSIGFANIVMQAWGNCRVGARIVGVDRARKVVVAEGAFLDLETNAQSIAPVDRRVVDKRGNIYNDDMIIVTGQAAASIARRNAILNGVARGIWHPIYLEALNVVRGDQKTFAENKDAAWKALAQFGISPEKALLVLGLKGEADMTFEHLPTLRGMYVALRDGQTTVEELLDPRRQTGGFETVSDPLGDDQKGGEDEGQAAEPSETASQRPTEARTEAPGQTATTPAAKQGDAQPVKPVAQDNAQKATDQRPKAAETPKQPATADEYVEHWRAVCDAATTVTAVRNAHAAERGLRKSCNLDEGHLEQVNAIRDARIAALTK